MIEVFGTISMFLAIAGVVLNNRKIKACFYVWLISNAISALIHYSAGLYSFVLRDVIFLLLAMEGLYKWSDNLDGKD